MPGAPSTGTYTFKVTSGLISASATDTQTVLRKIPFPKTSTFSPVEGKTLTCKSHVFSWEAVAAEILIFYRLEIKDMQDNRFFASSYIQGMHSIRPPTDQLKAGATYRWRIRAVDGSDWIVMNNRSNSEWREFSVGQTRGECEYMYEVPETFS